MKHYCRICSSTLTSISCDGIDSRLVSSDVRPISAILSLAYCQECTTLQKIIDENWYNTSKKIYETYCINHQGAGSEPMLYDPRLGKGPRAKILTQFILNNKLASSGKILDIGCANGNLLRELSHTFPICKLYGSEQSNRFKDTVLQISGVDGFFTGLTEIPNKSFQLIIMSHVLEHIEKPNEFLETVKTKLEDNGALLIVTPNIRRNPIDIFVLDHCFHFDKISLKTTLDRSKLQTVYSYDDFGGKEILTVAKLLNTCLPQSNKIFKYPINLVLKNFLQITKDMIEKAKLERAHSSFFGVLGTSSASLWISSNLDFKVDFFIDEDPSRIGNVFLGRPIFSLTNAPSNSTIFIPLSKNTAKKIVSRAPANRYKFVYSDGNSVSFANLEIINGDGK